MAVDTYFHYGFFDRRLNAEDKNRYLAEAPGANARLWSLTPNRFRLLYDNKLVFHHYFRSLGLPLASIFGVFDADLGRTTDGESLRTEADLARFLHRLPESGFVFKPVEGMRGHQVQVLVGPAPDDRGTYLSLSGERFDAARLIAPASAPEGEHRIFLIEERIRPHPELAELIGPTLCTVRVLTVVGRDGAPSIVGSVFKLQPKPVGVDQLLYGALGCWVDPETGALGPGRNRDHLGSTTVVPGTDRSFVGYRLPCWGQVKELALTAAAGFPWARAIGWDIAISDRGPILIEGNERWSPSLVQIPAPHGLMDGELKALYARL
jgi:hypothetical protein